MRRPTWTGTATPVSRPGTQARKIFVFDSIVVVRNPGGTLSPANLPPRSSANAASAPPCTWPPLLRWRSSTSSSPTSLSLVGVGNADAEVSRHTGSGRGRSHRLAGHFGLIARGVVPTERRGGG